MHGAGLGQLIVCGAGGTEAILEGDHLPKQIQILKGGILYRTLRHAPEAIIESRITSRYLAVGAADRLSFTFSAYTVSIM